MGKRTDPEDYNMMEITVAKAICRAQGDFNWKYLKDVDGNPSTAYAYYEYLKMGRAALKELQKLFAKNQCEGNFPRFLKGQK
jgi:hypothetical protein